MSQVISSNTVSNMLTVTKRTPASISRRASRQLWPKRFMPYFSRTASGSLCSSNASRAFLRRHQRVRLVEVGVQQPRVLRRLERADRLVDQARASSGAGLRAAPVSNPAAAGPAP